MPTERSQRHWVRGSSSDIRGKSELSVHRTWSMLQLGQWSRRKRKGRPYAIDWVVWGKPNHILAHMIIWISSEPSTFDYFAPVGSLYMTFLIKRTGVVCKPNQVVCFTLRYKTQWDVIASHLLSTITRMHRKHFIFAVVYDRFLFHAGIASKLATDKPTGGHAARRSISCHQCQHFPFILGDWICGITILKITQFRPIYTSSRLATVGFFDFCRRILHHFLNISGHFLEFSARVF